MIYRCFITFYTSIFNCHVYILARLNNIAICICNCDIISFHADKNFSFSFNCFFYSAFNFFSKNWCRCYFCSFRQCPLWRCYNNCRSIRSGCFKCLCRFCNLFTFWFFLCSRSLHRILFSRCLCCLILLWLFYLRFFFWLFFCLRFFHLYFFI